MSRFLVAGIAFGLMLGAKHSAVIFVGILFALLLADTLFFQKETRLVKLVLGRTAAFAGIFLIALAILWSFYGFRYRAISNKTAPTISVADYIRENGRPESINSFPARITEAISHTRIFPESYVLGMADVISWSSRNTVLFNRNYPAGNCLFFPVSLVVKTNIALVLLVPVGLIFLFFARNKWREGMFLLIPAIVFLIFASLSSFTNGVRHILPIYGFLIVLASAGAIWVCRKFNACRYVCVALLVFNTAAALRTAPKYLAFANDLWGGDKNTHRIFRGSNVDTGQSMKLVSEYLASQNIKDCWLASFVHPEMIRAVQPCRPMPSWLRPAVSRDPIDAVPPVIEGVVVLSVNELPTQAGDEYVPIAKSEPIAFIGANTYVYRGRFEVPLVAAISRVHRSNHFMRVNDIDQSISEARQAVELGPNDPRTHLALGLSLARGGQKEVARNELNKAAELAKDDARFRNQEVRANQELERLNRN